MNAALGFLPILSFLAALIHFDSFKLVRRAAVIRMILAGGFAAFFCSFINLYVMKANGVAIDSPDYIHYTRFIAPIVEEIPKALIIFILIATNRIGFAFDAAILGLSVGAGFALVENYAYLYTHGNEPIALWVVRGFGTAFMHSGTTAVFAVIAHVLTVHDDHGVYVKYLPGLALAIVLHATFNFFTIHPISSTAAMMLIFPITMLLLLRQDEKSIDDWIKTDFDWHKDLLKQIETGEFKDERDTRFLKRLNERYDPHVAARITYYVQVHTELVLAAETILKAHEKKKRMWMMRLRRS